MLAFVVLLATGAQAWQIVEELCSSSNIAVLMRAADKTWCSDEKPRCEWDGLFCDNAGELASVRLRDLALNITSLASLTAPGPFVHDVRLRNCSLGGAFPNAIQTSSVVALDLSYNNFTGNIPWAWASRAIYLDLSYNRLGGASELVAQSTSAPDNLYAGFGQLEALRLAGNAFYEDLTYFEFHRAVRLREFDVAGNKFYGTAPAFPSAKVYDVSGTYFSRIANCAPNDPFLHWPKTRLIGERTVPAKQQLCNAGDVPFRSAPPNWLADRYEECAYAYNPDNKIYTADDFATSA